MNGSWAGWTTKFQWCWAAGAALVAGCVWEPWAIRYHGSGADAGIATADLVADPHRHEGYFVTVNGLVERLVAPRVFFFAAERPVLVFVPGNVSINGELASGKSVQVSGEVRLTTVARLEALLESELASVEEVAWLRRTYGRVDGAVPYLAAVGVYPGR